MTRQCLLLFLVLLVGRPAAGQECDYGPSSGRLRVFLDCAVQGCDRTFFTAELPFVVWVREPADADVAVLVAAQQTGAGGTAYTVTFRSMPPDVARLDTVTRAVGPSASADEQRRTLSGALMLSLARYALTDGHTDGLATQLRVVLNDSASRGRVPPVERDHWNGWVFQVGGATNLSREQRARTFSFSGNVEARRVTEHWKASIGASGSANATRFELSDGSAVAFRQRSHQAQARVVRALTSHWSAGMTARVGRSDYRNQRLTVRSAPAVEYNVYPWHEATHRQLTLSYAAGTEYSRYAAETIYGKMSEAQPFHELVAAAMMQEQWGSFQATLSARQPIQELARYNLSGLVNANLRLTGGLALDMYLSGERIRYQPYLPRGTLTDEEILAGQRALATSYRIGSYVGLTYTFGSIFTAVVNPRLDRL